MRRQQIAQLCEKTKEWFKAWRGHIVIGAVLTLVFHMVMPTKEIRTILPPVYVSNGLAADGSTWGAISDSAPALPFNITFDVSKNGGGNQVVNVGIYY